MPLIPGVYYPNNVSLTMSGSAHENGTTDTHYSADIWLHVDSSTGERSFSGFGSGSTSSSSHYDRSASGAGNISWVTGSRHNSASISGSQSAVANGSSLYTWNEAVYSPTGQLVRVKQDYQQESSSNFEINASYTGTYWRNGTITDGYSVVGSFYIQGDLDGEWDASGTTYDKVTQGWQGQIQAPPGSAIGGGLASASTTSQYQTYNHKANHVSSGMEKFIATSGTYSRSVQQIQTSGLVWEKGKTTFLQAFSYENNNVDGKKIYEYSERNMSPDNSDKFEWWYVGSGSGSFPVTVMGASGTVFKQVVEGGDGKKQVKYWTDHEQHWNASGEKTVDRERRFDEIDHVEADEYSYNSDLTYNGGGTTTAEGRTTTWSANGYEHHWQNEKFVYSNAGSSFTEKNFGVVTSETNAGTISFNHTAHATRSGANYYDTWWTEPNRYGETHDMNSTDSVDNMYRFDMTTWNQSNITEVSITNANGTQATSWSHSWSVTQVPGEPDPELAGMVQMGSGGASGGSLTSGGASGSSTSWSYNQAHQFGTAGAYASLAGLPADWDNLKSEQSPYIFGGGWENKITSPEGLIPHVATDTETVEQIVARTDQSARANAEVSSNMQREAEEEQRRKEEENSGKIF